MLYFFVLTPITSGFSRQIEVEADLFGLNAARQPDGFAEATLKLAEYRKMSPSRIEEISSSITERRSRIEMACASRPSR